MVNIKLLRILFKSKWKWGDPSPIFHCVDRPEDTVEHRVKVCPALAEHRCVLREAPPTVEMSAGVAGTVQTGAGALATWAI